jgi:hypothetical protein
MSTTIPERLRGATRWSMAARCPRMAAYGLLGVDPEPPTPRDQGRFARGRDAGHYFARQMKAKHGEENVIEEAAVAWPAPPALPVGELHVDVVVKPDRLGIECKNTAWPDGLFDSAVTQIAGAVHFSPDIDTGLVVILDSDYQITNEWPVFLNDELIEKVETTAAAVVEAGKSGTLPERVCEKKADARGHFCPFADHCFADHEEEPARDAPELSALASEGWLIYRDLKQKKGETKELQERWDDWKARALEAEIPPGRTMSNGIEIKRSDRRGSHSFSLAKARAAGVWQSVHDEVFSAFIGQSSGSTTFDLTRTADAPPLDMDLGDDADHLADV